MSRDWTHRQLVYARNELRRAAVQLDTAIAHRAHVSTVETGLRAGLALGTALGGLTELRRVHRRLDPRAYASSPPAHEQEGEQP